MKYVIDETVLDSHSVSMEELLLLLYIKVAGEHPSILFQKLKKEKKAGEGNNNPEQCYVSMDSDDIISQILLESDKTVPTQDRAEALAEQMMKIFPEGRKEGTNTYWRCNKKDVSLKLKKFFKIYGNYTDEQILTATKAYVDSFHYHYKLMRVLKYFIWKSVVKFGEDGNHVEDVSDLATLIENANTADSHDVEIQRIV